MNWSNKPYYVNAFTINAHFVVQNLFIKLEFSKGFENYVVYVFNFVRVVQHTNNLKTRMNLPTRVFISIESILGTWHPEWR